MNVDSINIKAIKATNLRVDASYHLSEGQEVKRIINSCPYEMLTIKDVSSDIFIGGRAKRVYVTKKEHGIPFLSSSDILQADLENVKLASKKYTPNLEQMKLKKGWTLITRSGTIGNCAFANAKHAQKLASEHVIRVYPNNILRQGLIYAYLTSKYGHSLLTQGTFGAVIQHIEPAFVGSLPIPNFPESFQIEIDKLIQESAKLREEATDALDDAVLYFDTKFKIEDDMQNFFTKRVKDLSFSFASYNNNLEVNSFINQYSNDSIKLKDITSKVFAPPLFKHIYLSKDNG
ncbi:restriction endonuclease subunit S [Bacteroides nordii]|uniref:restriction endonuclease subunit S n=1 Tax=Bacteroides nordii TaxID=291645 RepID=UPI003520D687